ncbi:MAG: histidine triad nucleotide-binding protein [Planctomycetota bacterium]
MPTDADCLFCKIVAGDIPAETVYEDDRCLAFRDINPQAPTHILLIPKDHIARLDDLDDTQRDLAGRLLERAAHVAREEGLSEGGFRTVINTGAGGGQEVFHIHIHLLAGRPFAWPPG